MNTERLGERSEKSLEPFLRWAGGKRWLAKSASPVLKRLLQSTGGTYFEPFLGSGAMFFGLAPQHAHLSDINGPLIQTYRTVLQSACEVERLIADYPVTPESYYALREAEPHNPIEAAARFIFLNRTCYGGIYRENRAGNFNTPYGGGSRTPERILKGGLIARAQVALRGANLACCDFEEAISQARSGDVVYCDPTYSNVSRDAFDRYGANLFGWSDQERLALSAERAMGRGVTVLVSNGSFEDLIDLYPAAYRISFEKKKTIGNKPNHSGRHQEYLFILDPKSRVTPWRRIGLVENRKSKVRIAVGYQDPLRTPVHEKLLCAN